MSDERKLNLLHFFYCRFFYAFLYFKHGQTRTVGMGQYQSFDLLVCRFAADCRVCSGVALESK